MEKELKIMMLEDSEDDAFMIDRLLKKENFIFNAIRVDTRDEFIQGLETYQPDVILSDHALPQFNSVEALRICKERKLHMPFILVTGTVSEEFAVACLKNGADDYVLKSNLSRLPMAIRYAIRHHRHEKVRHENEIELLRQNEELVKLNRELDLFVYSTSHNLRAPLRSVLGLVNLSKREVAKENLKALPQYLDMMVNSIDQLDHTLKNIVEYSKTSRLDDDVEEIDFEKFFHKIFNSLRFSNGQENVIEGIINVHPGPPLFCGKTRLSVVLLNLIANAFKYYDPAKDQSFIKMEVFLEPGRTRITIQDNGIGIAASSQKRVFDMFYRATEKSEGSGLGLYIVREAVERMNGTISLQSEEHVGTTFTVTIPSMKIY